ncbi:hypothetical protein ROZALSC1DRAFT_28765 [Rozella allomycis CSF55]|uniref:Uncharacterized protein n=1 Tax=Rozella allomycis (strain CSF55) TaxID=988480 RepID=A0A4P9YJR0_ROZAC|nr:hypothetical protein ROZALSC1DRAFT_28765 [Rozella allomycis CSF55]
MVHWKEFRDKSVDKILAAQIEENRSNIRRPSRPNIRSNIDQTHFTRLLKELALSERKNKELLETLEREKEGLLKLTANKENLENELTQFKIRYERLLTTLKLIKKARKKGEGKENGFDFVNVRTIYCKGVVRFGNVKPTKSIDKDEKETTKSIDNDVMATKNASTRDHRKVPPEDFVFEPIPMGQDPFPRQDFLPPIDYNKTTIPSTPSASPPLIPEVPPIKEVQPTVHRQSNIKLKDDSMDSNETIKELDDIFKLSTFPKDDRFKYSLHQLIEEQKNRKSLATQTESKPSNQGHTNQKKKESRFIQTTGKEDKAIGTDYNPPILDSFLTNFRDDESIKSYHSNSMISSIPEIVNDIERFKYSTSSTQNETSLDYALEQVIKHLNVL